MGVDPPQNVWAHVCGSDLVRDKNGTVYVLEDNLRVPSGVSYMLENRQVMKRVFPELFRAASILPVDDYPSQLYDCLASISPRTMAQPELVEGRDLVVGDDDYVYMRAVEELIRVDVIYRRIDDLFIDPEAFIPIRC